MTHMNDKPPSQRCSKCNQILEPQPFGQSIDSNFNTVQHYIFGHQCPEQLRKYRNRLDEIEHSNMTEEQKHNARTMAGYMNSWSN